MHRILGFDPQYYQNQIKQKQQKLRKQDLFNMNKTLNKAYKYQNIALYPDNIHNLPGFIYQLKIKFLKIRNRYFLAL